MKNHYLGAAVATSKFSGVALRAPFEEFGSITTAALICEHFAFVTTPIITILVFTGAAQNRSNGLGGI